MMATFARFALIAVLFSPLVQATVQGVFHTVLMSPLYWNNRQNAKASSSINEHFCILNCLDQGDDCNAFFFADFNCQTGKMIQNEIPQSFEENVIRVKTTVPKDEKTHFIVQTANSFVDWLKYSPDGASTRIQFPDVSSTISFATTALMERSLLWCGNGLDNKCSDMKAGQPIFNNMTLGEAKQYQVTMVPRKGEVWVLGGVVAWNNIWTTERTFICNERSRECRNGPDLPFKWRVPCVVELKNDKYLLAGGMFWNVNSNDAMVRTVILDWTTKEYERQGDLKQERAFAACGLLDYEIDGVITTRAVIAGGRRSMDETDLVRSVELFNFDTGEWTAFYTEPHLIPVPVAKVASMVIDNELYLFGGSKDSNDYATAVQKYTPGKGWTIVQYLPAYMTPVSQVFYLPGTL